MLCPDSSSCRDTPRLASSLKEFLIYITTAKRWPLLISASFGPTAVRVITATVYSGRREAGLVMTSLGEKESGRFTVNELLALKPEYASIARTELGKLAGPGLVEHLIDGLRKAGLEIAPEKGAEIRDVSGAANRRSA